MLYKKHESLNVVLEPLGFSFGKNLGGCFVGFNAKGKDENLGW